MSAYTYDFSEQLTRHIVADLEEVKAIDITILDVRPLTGITDFMIVATGGSKRHTRALAEKVVFAAKRMGHPPLGVEGKEHGEWILVDLCDVVVHIMIAEARDLYQLERLWRNAGYAALPNHRTR
uniref:Ribosomal silencing factor RsfS n=1 Tax=Candidatus Kentrum sp. TC TaxID=2126339 RepID=A0A450ZC68_9GAMM|nr:MAG: ribosome-associated protein [Candidatus Kentron sp. TC]VFK51379.1 MAG: ribosome-associated protein [Candidatus Kentron sp. TC]